MLLDEKEAFFKRVQDRVVFSRGSAASDPVDVMVRFSELAPNFILGEIPGTNATHATLEPVFNEKSEAFYCKMESVFPSGPARLASSTVWFRSISRRGWNEPQPADEPLHIVGEFECAELLIDERNLRRDLELRSRSITFYLPEGGLLWGDASRRLDFQAFTLRPSGDEDIDPGIECLFTMKGTPCLIYDRTERTSTRTLSCILPTLVCSTKEPEEEYSDDAFHAHARRLVDDVLLLASLACRRVIRWHRYNSFGRHGQQTLVRSIRLRSQPSDRTYVPELPVALYRFHDFVRLAIPSYASLESKTSIFRCRFCTWWDRTKPQSSMRSSLTRCSASSASSTCTPDPESWTASCLRSSSMRSGAG